MQLQKENSHEFAIARLPVAKRVTLNIALYKWLLFQLFEMKPTEIGGLAAVAGAFDCSALTSDGEPL